MLFLGFSGGIPLLLIFSSLSLWLREAGIERGAVTFFSWAALGYSFKFVWAPLVDTVPVPWLTKYFGRRRAWLFISQCLIAVAIVFMASVDPSKGTQSLQWMAIAAVLLGFSSATQDIVIDAYRIESAEQRLQAMMSSSYIAGYRIAMVVSGAGALKLASYFGSDMNAYAYDAWRWTYLIMACTLLVGVVTTLIVSEPQENKSKNYIYATLDYLRLLLVFGLSLIAFVSCFFYSASLIEVLKSSLGEGPMQSFLAGSFRLLLALAAAVLVGIVLVRARVVKAEMARRTWIEPISDFFQRYGVKTAVILLSLIGLYRISDIVLGVISNVFYQDMGFSKDEIAEAVKAFGLFVTIAGGFLGGLFAARFGVIRSLLLGAVMSSLTNLLFIWLSFVGHDVYLMYGVVAADNLAAGFASAAFVAFLSSLTSVSFTAIQYALFSSLMTLFPKVLGGYSGGIVDQMGYPGFFTFTTILGLPVIGLCLLAARHLKPESSN